MDGRTLALLGQWVDIVGRGGGGHPHAAHGHRWGRRRWPGYNFGDYGDYGNGADTDDDSDYGAPPYAPYPYPYPAPAPYAAPLMPPPAPEAPASAPTAAAGWYPQRAYVLGNEGPGAFPFPPRAALVEHPAPTQADRWILPMSTGVPILPTQSAQITGRPQAQAYQCNRFVISNSGTSGGAADWIVNDIKVGNQSQFVQSGDVPGDMFATNAIDTFVRFQTAQTAMDVVVVVTYIGLNESGVPFFGAMLGTAAV